MPVAPLASRSRLHTWRRRCSPPGRRVAWAAGIVGGHRADHIGTFEPISRHLAPAGTPLPSGLHGPPNRRSRRLRRRWHAPPTGDHTTTTGTGRPATTTGATTTTELSPSPGAAATPGTPPDAARPAIGSCRSGTRHTSPRTRTARPTICVSTNASRRSGARPSSSISIVTVSDGLGRLAFVAPARLQRPPALRGAHRVGADPPRDREQPHPARWCGPRIAAATRSARAYVSCTRSPTSSPRPRYAQ